MKNGTDLRPVYTDLRHGGCGVVFFEESCTTIQYIIYLCSMKRTVIAFGNYYNDFIKTLRGKELLKFKYVLSLLETSDRMPVKFIKYIRDGLYELRMEYSGNSYRIFFVFDSDCVVILFNGFQKKTQKTPENEINKALKIKEAYYAYKQSYDNKHK